MDKHVFFSNLQEEETQLLKEQVILNKKIEALQVLIKYYKVEPQEVKPLFSVDAEGVTFNPNTTKTKKSSSQNSKQVDSKKTERIVEALAAIREGTARDTSEKLIELYPEYETVDYHLMVKQALSRLNGQGEVSGEKIKNKNSFMYKYIGRGYGYDLF